MTPQTPFPPPLIIPPLRSPHKQTFILLHGRGSNPSRFGPILLTTPFTTLNSPTPQTLPTAFPYAKFIFPAAPRRRATIYKRTLTTQWFDSWHLDAPPSDYYSDVDDDDDLLTTKPRQRRRGAACGTGNDWLMIDGLRETTGYLHALVREEIGLLPAGARGIVLGGISQGCAASLVAAVLWDGEEKLGGVVGMCGWLPFVEGVERAMAGGEGGGEDGVEDLFERDGEEEEVRERKGGVEVLREMLELEANTAGKVKGTPVFMGHGDGDEAVPLELGRRSAECLEKMGMDVEWKEYRGLGHWYSEEMLGDMVGFLKARSGWLV